MVMLHIKYVEGYQNLLRILWIYSKYPNRPIPSIKKGANNLLNSKPHFRVDSLILPVFP